jgi:hypothetical protein
MTGERDKLTWQRSRQRKTWQRNTNNENARREKNMTNPKKTIRSLLERTKEFYEEGKLFSSIDCLSQAVGIMAENLQEPKPEDKPEGFVLEKQVALDSFKRNLTDIDIMVIWRLGLASWDAAKNYGAKFPHE